MRVFVSHSSKDKPAVEALAQVLRARGIDRSGLTETHSLKSASWPTPESQDYERSRSC